MKELEYKDQDRGMYTLYELTDGGKILIFSSYYQGELWDICFIYNNSIDNIETAIEFANRIESQFYDNGKVYAYFTKLDLLEKPMNNSEITKLCDIYYDYFTDLKEAEEFYQNTLKV